LINTVENMSLENKEKAQVKFQENISSFVDDELAIRHRDELDELITQLSENEEKKQVWGRYCVMREAIKKTLPKTVHHDLLTRVQTALESEPALIMSDNYDSSNKTPITEKAEVVSLSNVSPSVNQANVAAANDSMFKPVFAFGIAATVTIAAVLGFQLFTQTEDLPQKSVVASNDASINNEPATQKIQIASQPTSKLVVPSTAVSLVVDELHSRSDNVTYAEQSLMDDGRWTRITQVGGVPLANQFISGKAGAEAQVRFKLQNENSALARSVKLENTPAK
jgi:negative regulator of sigma E activity